MGNGRASSDFDELFRQVRATSESDAEARERFFEAADRGGYLNHLRVASYRCAKKGCGLVDVIRLGDLVLARSRDYKLRPHTNAAQSVPSARRKNLNSDNHWPGHVFDLTALAVDGIGIPANCSHGQRVLPATEILAAISGVEPGHAGKPTLL